jgi:hypothetical protein
VNAGSYTTIKNLATNTIVAYLSILGRSGSRSTQHGIEDPTSPNRPILMSNNTDGAFYYKQALTCYALPNDAPERPPNTGVRISYQIDVLY